MFFLVGKLHSQKLHYIYPSSAIQWKNDPNWREKHSQSREGLLCSTDCHNDGRKEKEVSLKLGHPKRKTIQLLPKQSSSLLPPPKKKKENSPFNPPQTVFLSSTLQKLTKNLTTTPQSPTPPVAVRHVAVPAWWHHSHCAVAPVALAPAWPPMTPARRPAAPGLGPPRCWPGGGGCRCPPRQAWAHLGTVVFLVLFL